MLFFHISNFLEEINILPNYLFVYFFHELFFVDAFLI